MIQVLKNVFKDPKRFKVATLQVWPRSYGIFRIYVQVMGHPRYMFRLWVALGMSKKSWYFREVWYSKGRFAPSMAANRGKIDLNCNKLGVAALQVWPRI